LATLSRGRPPLAPAGPSSISICMPKVKAWAAGTKYLEQRFFFVKCEKDVSNYRL